MRFAAERNDTSSAQRRRGSVGGRSDTGGRWLSARRRRRGPALIAAAAVVLMLLPAAVALAHNHADLPNRERVEPSVRLDVGVGERGSLPLYITVKQALIGEKSGFGVKLFVDTVQLYTNETVTSAQHSFALDLRKLGPGYHYLLVNVCDHHDHIGVGAIWVQVTDDLRVIRYSNAPRELVKRWREGDTDWPGKLKEGISPTDPLRDDAYLNCCGEYSPWPIGSNDRDFFVMRSP